MKRWRELEAGDRDRGLILRSSENRVRRYRLLSKFSGKSQVGFNQGF